LPRLRDSLDEYAAWDRRLSLGELQRVAFVRLLLLKARWNLLDEITSAIDEDLESRLYEQLTDALPDAAIISIAHRSSLRRFHRSELNLGPDGSWRVAPIHQSGPVLGGRERSA